MVRQRILLFIIGVLLGGCFLLFFIGYEAGKNTPCVDQESFEMHQINPGI